MVILFTYSICFFFWSIYFPKGKGHFYVNEIDSFSCLLIKYSFFSNRNSLWVDNMHG